MNFECSNPVPMQDKKMLRTERSSAVEGPLAVREQAFFERPLVNAYYLRRARSLAMIAGCAALLAACGGGGSGADAVSPTASGSDVPSAENPAPAPAPSGSSGSATLSWTAPQTNADGSTLSDLGGYKIYYGTSSGNYTGSVTVPDPAATTYTIQDLTASTYYFVLKAYDKSSVESAPSAEVSKTIQ